MLDIRAYQSADEKAVVELWNMAFAAAPPTDPPAEDIHRKLAVQPELFLVAYQETVLAGTAMGGYDGHRGWVYYVAVRPNFRRRGIGTSLMAVLQEKLRALGCVKINLQVLASNRTACAFYRKLGYLEEERVSMGKRLDAAPAHQRR